MSAEPFLGEIQMVAFSFVPKGFAACDGTLLPIIGPYSALFSLLGTTYGGDGINHFALPDLRGRGPVSAGAGPGLHDIAMGQKAGAEEALLSTSQLPVHTHAAVVRPGAHAQLNCLTSAGSVASPSNAIPALVADASSGTLPAYAFPDKANATMAPLPLAMQIDVGPTGGGAPVGLRNPYLGINFIIAIQGVYPARA